MTVADQIKKLTLLKKLLADKKIFDLRKALNDKNSQQNPNFKILQKSIDEQVYDDKGELVEGSYRGAELPGSSRSGKTWSGVDIIIWLCLFKETHCTINIYRETYNEFKTTLYDDFKRRLDDFGLPNPFHNAKEIKSFKIGKNVISFLGDGKHGGGCDYAFFNEVMFIGNALFDQVEMRCRKFWWADYNPSFTDHWFFKVADRPDVVSLKTTFRDNPFISPGERNKILGYEPWRSGSYIIKNDEIHCYNKISGKVEVISDKNQPPPHPTNIKNGTADEYMWKVYGLGLRGAMKGQIFKDVNYIDEFPVDMAYSYGLDFGFTTDPCTLTKCAEDENNIWIELLSYHPIESSEAVNEFLESIGIEKDLPITADSSDKYTSENNGAVEMVKDLRKKGWKISKVNKTKSVMFHLLAMKEKKIHIVNNHLIKFAKTEQQNYKLREIHGIFINQPVDKFNHMWDSARYRHMAFKSVSVEEQQTKSSRQLGVNY